MRDECMRRLRIVGELFDSDLDPFQSSDFFLVIYFFAMAQIDLAIELHASAGCLCSCALLCSLILVDLVSLGELLTNFLGSGLSAICIDPRVANDVGNAKTLVWAFG